jgi:AcrR family transcriptional regulator
VERRPRTKPRGERRRDLLDAAESVLVDKGMAALTVDEVTARAGVAKGTFYLYFQSRDDVLAALRERFVEHLVAVQRAELDTLPDGDWPGRLELWMESSLRGYLAHVRLHDALFLHATGDRAPRGAAHPANEHLQLLVDILRSGAAAGDFAVDSPEAAAILLYAAMHGAADHLIDNPGHIAADELVGEARRWCRQLATR